MECSIQAWSPWLKSDIDILEKVQRRAVNMVIGLKGKTYEEKRKEVGLISLYDRRIRGDMIQVWNVLHGNCLMDPSMLKSANTQHSRYTRHTSKKFNLERTTTKLEIRRNFFSVRCVDPWNKLPERIQDSDTLDDFKADYDEFMQCGILF